MFRRVGSSSLISPKPQDSGGDQSLIEFYTKRRRPRDILIVSAASRVHSLTEGSMFSFVETLKLIKLGDEHKITQPNNIKTLFSLSMNHTSMLPDRQDSTGEERIEIRYQF